MQYEQWLRAIIHAISDDYKLSDEEAEGIFKRILRRLKRHYHKERRGNKNGIF